MKLRRLLNPVLIVILVIVALPGVLHAQAGDPSPADGTVDVSPVNTTLSAAIEGTGDPVNVEFRGRAKQSFSIVALPDTQKYSASYPEIFEAQTQWVADNQTVRNIVFVTHEGDIVDTYTSGTQWANASAAISKLGGVPYGLAVGNHDFDYDTDQSDLFDQTFGHIYCTGSYPSGSKRNNYRTFTACGVPLLVLHLEFWPDSDDLEWAYDVLQSYPDRMAIITTHGFLDESGNREVHVMGSTAYIWDALVLGKFGDVQMSPNDNVHFILCGHVHAEYTKSTWVDNADGQGGRYVHQLLADYQDNYDGWLRIMTFVPGEDTVYVQTYSPVLDQYQTDSDSEFTLSVPMAETPTDYELLGTHKGVAYGTRTSVVWPYDLNLGTAYEWYVTVSDGFTSENGPIWDFTTTATNVTVDLQSPVDQTVSQNPVPFTVEASCLLGTLVDASLYLGSPAQAEDAQITADNPDTNMGDNASINVDGASPHAHALIRFRGLFGHGPGQVPPGTTIDSAELRIYCTDAGNTMDLYRVTSDWSQASVTWNTAPSYDTSLSLPLDCSATGSRQATVTQFVQAWSDGQSNYGVLLTDTGTDGVDFHSTEGATRPVLSITYTDLNAQSVTATFTAGSSDLAWVDTQALAGTLDTATFSTTLSDGDYLWNCLVRTDEGGTIWETWATSDAQFAFDGPDPLVAHTGPDRAVSDTDGDGSQDVTLDASASTGLIQSYEWDINGDGEVDATGQTPTITLAVSDQAYTIALTVTDDAATSDTDTVLITVNANEAPVADAGPDQTVSSTDTITLDGSGSSDDGSIVSYVWTEGAAILGSDQILDLTGSLPIGSHTVTLTVTDEAMVEDTDTVVINVELAPLYLDDFESGGFSEGGWGVSAQASVDASAAYEGTYGALLKKTSSMVTRIDKDGATGVTVSYYAKTDGLTGPDEKLTVEWSEDGENWTAVSPSTTSSYETFSHEISFDPQSASSSFRIRFGTNGGAGNDQAMIDNVQVKPSNGGTDNAPPTADFSYTASNLNLTFIDESIDSDGTISSWLWDFGDGSSSTAQNPSHTYASDGSYTVTLTVTDDDDKIGTTSQDVTVSSGTTNSPPSADFSYIASDLNLTFADESIDSDGTISSWLWDFDDDSSSTVQNPSHTYASDGSYIVTLTVTDDAGEIGTAVKSITVTTASASTVTVSHIDMKKKIAGKNYFAQAVATVSDQDGAFVADAVVYGEWYFNGDLLASAVSNGTAGDGKVTLDAPKQQTAGTFLFLVTNVVFSDYTYKPTITEASVTVP